VTMCHILVFPAVQSSAFPLKLCKQILPVVYKNYSKHFLSGKGPSNTKQPLMNEGRKFQESEA